MSGESFTIINGEWMPQSMIPHRGGITSYQFRVEVSPSGRAKCRVCGEVIPKDVVRTGVPLRYSAGEFGYITSWRHQACSRLIRDKPDVDLEAFRAVISSEVFGWNDISTAQQKEFVNEFLSTEIPEDLQFDASQSSADILTCIPMDAPPTMKATQFMHQKEGLGYLVGSEGDGYMAKYSTHTQDIAKHAQQLSTNTKQILPALQQGIVFAKVKYANISALYQSAVKALGWGQGDVDAEVMTPDIALHRLAQGLKVDSQVMYDFYGGSSHPLNNAEMDIPGSVAKGGILADEMGLGKTLQIISLIYTQKYRWAQRWDRYTASLQQLRSSSGDMCMKQEERKEEKEEIDLAAVYEEISMLELQNDEYAVWLETAKDEEVSVQKQYSAEAKARKKKMQQLQGQVRDAKKKEQKQKKRGKKELADMCLEDATALMGESQWMYPHPGAGPTLIITPAAAMTQWLSELERYVPITTVPGTACMHEKHTRACKGDCGVCTGVCECGAVANVAAIRNLHNKLESAPNDIAEQQKTCYPAHIPPVVDIGITAPLTCPMNQETHTLKPLKVFIYYGDRADISAVEQSHYDVVLTTYSVVEYEYRKVVNRQKEKCEYCGKQFLERGMRSHQKYFCGPNSARTQKQQKRERGESDSEDDDNAKNTMTSSISRGLQALGVNMSSSSSSSSHNNNNNSNNANMYTHSTPTMSNIYREIMIKGNQQPYSMYEKARVHAEVNLTSDHEDSEGENAPLAPPRRPPSPEVEWMDSSEDEQLLLRSGRQAGANKSRSKFKKVLDSDSEEEFSIHSISDDSSSGSESDYIVEIGEPISIKEQEPIVPTKRRIEPPTKKARMTAPAKKKVIDTDDESTDDTMKKPSRKKPGKIGPKEESTEDDTMKKGKNTKNTTSKKAGATATKKKTTPKKGKNTKEVEVHTDDEDNLFSSDDDNTSIPGKSDKPKTQKAKDKEAAQEARFGRYKVSSGAVFSSPGDWRRLFTDDPVSSLADAIDAARDRSYVPIADDEGLGCDLGQSPLHTLWWGRVVCDEAHKIKGRGTSTNRAVLSLRADARFAVSGTPCLNRVDELYSFLQFIQLRPAGLYLCNVAGCSCNSFRWSFGSDNRHCIGCDHAPTSHYSYFRNFVSNPIKHYGFVGEGKKGLHILQTIQNMTILRRTKKEREADLEQPPLIHNVENIEMTAAEQDFYQCIYTQSRTKFNSFVQRNTLLANFSHLFSILTRLRQCTNHPYLVLFGGGNETDADNTPTQTNSGGDTSTNKEEENKTDTMSDEHVDGIPWILRPESINSGATHLRSTPGDNCAICKGDIEGTGAIAKCKHTFHSECLREYLVLERTKAVQKQGNVAEVPCPSCFIPLVAADQVRSVGSCCICLRAGNNVVNLPCGHSIMCRACHQQVTDKRCVMCRADVEKTIDPVQKSGKRSIIERLQADSFTTSSKLSRIVSICSRVTKESSSARILVFSQYSQMLNQCEFALISAGISAAKYTGALSMQQRDAILRAFRNPDGPQVQLQSLRGGGEGLNLQVANHVIQCEPWWNYALQSQAIQRCHRIGQTKPVSSYQLVVKDSIEEKMLQLQQRKNLMIQGSLDQNTESFTQLSHEDLQFLFE